MVATIYSSQILGTRRIWHCRECRPPSKMSLEFQASPGTAMVKYGGVGCLLLMVGMCLLLMLFSLGR
ncbi:MAG: hypothetical protein M5U21_08640 [Fimbriimonadaceae bacterium]|nr:hypothetical protein [Fimbriimonadaceae bacterium]